MGALNVIFTALSLSHTQASARIDESLLLENDKKKHTHKKLRREWKKEN